MFEGTYEYAKSTQRMITLVHRTEAIRRSDVPYVYVSKELYKRLGGVIPREGEALPGPTRIRITVETEEEPEDE
ncbi:hypothetical protein LCGC14_0363790 [marine sediment metagenome]|uniref:Uncharacterized protein n=1 Tax=marine sediment metagenome TaxID=412755 RepID=A0A0F9T730_9ZZZZ